MIIKYHPSKINVAIIKNGLYGRCLALRFKRWLSRLRDKLWPRKLIVETNRGKIIFTNPSLVSFDQMVVGRNADDPINISVTIGYEAKYD